MKNTDYRQKRSNQEKRSMVIGIALAASVHVFIFVFGVFSGFKYIYPPPQEKSILIEFEEVKEPAVVKVRAGRQPRAEIVDSKKPINLVQQAEGQHIGTKTNEAMEATMGDQGDVEMPEPPREKEINRRALFSAADNKTQKDTLAAQTGSKVTDALKEGHAQGNTARGKTQGEPNAKLKGRKVVGTLPSPSYGVQASGIVVVTIWVDNYGTVQKAVPGASGTTVADSNLWNAARKAAMEAHFDMSSDAPPMQEGTITYIFNLK